MPFESINANESDISEVSWYAVYTRHQHEKMVDQILTHKGFDTFLPLYESAHKWKDRTKVLSLPLFPSYVFLKGGIERRLQILTTPGIYGLVSSAGQPAEIPDGEIEAIRRIIDSGTKVDAHPFLKCGSRVRVKYGPLTGIEGLLVRKKNHYRLVLSVEILGTAASIEVEATQVEVVNGGRSREGDEERGYRSQQIQMSRASA